MIKERRIFGLLVSLSFIVFRTFLNKQSLTSTFFARFCPPGASSRIQTTFLIIMSGVLPMCYQGTTNIYYFKQLAFSSLRVQAEKSPAALSNGVTV
jgi:hypothetical protein